MGAISWTMITMTKPDTSNSWVSPSGLFLATETKDMPVGWYAGLRCWDTQEGFIPSAAYWDGQRWNEGNTWTHYWHKNFANEKEAGEFALEHDPDW